MDLLAVTLASSDLRDAEKACRRALREEQNTLRRPQVIEAIRGALLAIEQAEAASVFSVDRR